ncbi:bifunctional DNA-formamidopyrimidine glycosylase/DNA-(apurinic or apyrimidinic site) lyase [candidate division WWE3 bacterium]|uniref:Bifunctional DNA-formamidopyrimidine glycosylase/DNA-(Apurinic or apyrimidinic site) lyase n=1 Tax=candidate division WWE3 bacterium TaxID=2053526 RepID=A0A955LW26_UNCKA|nr:bifunctional DNA-formamidopyrimidine glycosylase/DNA-(apurinic or apyrimidinic site) lyase [candidate division WWE3 bacterium]
MIIIMPELPEVQTVVSQVDREISGWSIEDITYVESKMLQPDPDTFISHVNTAMIESVGRLAKVIALRLRLNNGESGVVLIHLKMTGRLLVREVMDEDDPYTQVVFTLKSGAGEYKQLRYTSARKFGYVKYLSTDAFDKLREQSYGPDTYTELELEEFKSILSNRTKKVKDVIMDQSLMTGVGNIYANDALWFARILPNRKAKTLSKKEAERLLLALKDVLREGLRKGGASDNWFRDAHGNKGSYQENFKIYGKKGEPCSRCGTIVKYEKIGGRGTFYCEVCQK